MGNQIKRSVGTQICFANHSGDFAPSGQLDLRQGTPGETQLTLTAATTAARQSAKVDLGELRAPAYSVDAVLHWATAPVIGTNVEVYWAPSHDPTAGNGNPALLTGSDAAYTGYADLDDCFQHMTHIGNFSASDYTAWPQIGHIGVFSPPSRYGIVVINNETAQALSAYTSQMHIVFTPIIDEVE